MEDAFGDTAHQLWLGGFQGCCCCVFVAGCDRFLDLAKFCANLGAAHFVNSVTGRILAGALFGLR